MNEQSLVRPCRIMIVLAYMLSAVWGIRAVFEPAWFEQILFSILIGIMMTEFCMVDAKIRGRPLPWSLSWLIYLSWQVFVPGYLFITRGVRKIHWVLLAMIGYIAVSWLTFYIMWFVAFGIH
jgi:hypothetical protein